MCFFNLFDINGKSLVVKKILIDFLTIDNMGFFIIYIFLSSFLIEKVILFRYRIRGGDI